MELLKSNDLTEVKFRLSPEFVESYRDRQPPFGFGALSQIVYLRTYSRLKPDGTNESWHETVQRVVEGTYSMQRRWIRANDLEWNQRKAQRSAQEMYERVFSLKFVPPGRGLWAMGSSLTEERGLWAALLNCAFTSTARVDQDPTEPFTFLMEASMLGIGTGFDTKGAGKVLVRKPAGDAGRFEVPDTREGWVDSVRKLLGSYFAEGAAPLDFSYDLVRVAGTAIKGFGGTAAGPECLRELHRDVRAVLDAAAGSPLTSTGIVDLMNLIGKCVVAGNLRRTAEIAFGEPGDQEFLELKNYDLNPHRAEYGWTSNNSVFAPVGMDYGDVGARVAQNGEPGLAWLENMRAFGRMGDPANNRDRRVAGGNPCKPLSAYILTPSGYVTFAEALDVPDLKVVLPDGRVAGASRPFVTGFDRDVWRIGLSNGLSLYGTPDHRHRLKDGSWKRIDELRLGDQVDAAYPDIHIGATNDASEYDSGVLHGWLWADGTYYRRGDSSSMLASLAIGVNEFECAEMLEGLTGTVSRPHGQKPETCKTLRVPLAVVESGFEKEDLSWLRRRSASFKRGFLRAVFTCDGSVRNGGEVVELYATRRRALEQICLVLAEFGMKAGLTVHNNARNYVGSDGKPRNNATTYKLILSGRHYAVLGFLSTFKNGQLSAKRPGKLKPVRVAEIDPAWSVEDVYDITVDDESHAFLDTAVVSHNCLEQSLEDMECCCLVETFPANHDSFEDFQKTLKFAYLYAKTVTLGRTPWSRTNAVMLRNRRIGLSQSGIVQAIAKLGIDEYRQWCERGYKAIQEYDRTYSEWFAIPRSIKTTSVKPSGSVSLLGGATPGMHFPEAKTYIRRMRLSRFSDLVKPLERAGYNIEPCFGDASSVVVEIPVRIDEDVRTAAEVSMWEQLSLAAFLQRHWADNQVSCTVTFDPGTEGPQIAHALSYFQYQLKGVSFLPRLAKGAYPQMPYEAVTEEEYRRLADGVKPLRLRETHEAAEAERFCTNDVCAIAS